MAKGNGGNATTAGAVEQLAMAEQISERYARMLHVNDPRTIADFKAIALAAIIETQELIAQFIERDVPFERDGEVVGRCSGDMITATAIRSGQQFRKDV